MPRSSLFYRSDASSNLGHGVFKTVCRGNISGWLRPLLCIRRNCRGEFLTAAGIRAGGHMALKTPTIGLEHSGVKRYSPNNGIGHLAEICLGKI